MTLAYRSVEVVVKVVKVSYSRFVSALAAVTAPFADAPKCSHVWRTTIEEIGDKYRYEVVGTCQVCGKKTLWSA